MSLPSTRFARALAGLVALVLVPVVLHSYLGIQRDDCRAPLALAPAEHASALERGRDAWMREHFAASAWREGRIAGASGAPTLSYTVVRSYDAKRVYYRPENTLLRGHNVRARELEWVDAHDVRLPIHRPRYASPGASLRAVAGYLLVYEGRPVADPYRAQLLAAARQLLGGSAPMTLFFVHGSATVEQVEETELRVRTALREQWERYRSSCLP